MQPDLPAVDCCNRHSSWIDRRRAVVVNLKLTKEQKTPEFPAGLGFPVPEGIFGAAPGERTLHRAADDPGAGRAVGA